MQNNVAVTLSGNITADLDLNYTKSKTPVTNFNIASTARFWNAEDEEWVDAETVFTRCVLWNLHAENAVATYHKGDRVIVTGVMTAKPWKDEEGNARVNYELVVHDIGASTLFATLDIKRNNAQVNEDDEEEEKPAAKTAAKRSANRRTVGRKR